MSEQQQSQSHQGAFLKSFGYALVGIWTLFLTQRNARVHLALTAVALVLAVGFGLSRGEWAVLVLTIAMVLAAEAFNTAIEALIDLVSPSRHPMAKRAKDVAAGGVLLAAIAAAAIGALLFLPHILALLLPG